MPKSERARVVAEIRLLASIHHDKIINFFGTWFDKENEKVVFITEIVTAGNLRSYGNLIFILSFFFFHLIYVFMFVM